jgi:hypothetical protein
VGVSNAFVDQPGVQFIVGFDPEARREETLADETDLVLDPAFAGQALTLLPARGRRAGHRINQMVTAHLHRYTPSVPDRTHRKCLERIDLCDAMRHDGAHVRSAAIGSSRKVTSPPRISNRAAPAGDRDHAAPNLEGARCRGGTNGDTGPVTQALPGRPSTNR